MSGSHKQKRGPREVRVKRKAFAETYLAVAAAVFLRPPFALSASAVKAAASRTAMSARTLRSMVLPVALSPEMNCEYDIPFRRAAALMRAIQRVRKSPLRSFRPANDEFRALSTACFAMRCPRDFIP